MSPLSTFSLYGHLCWIFITLAILRHILSAERSLPKPLNCEEEQHMRVFYEQKIQEVCLAFKFPHKIQVNLFIYFRTHGRIADLMQIVLLPCRQLQLCTLKDSICSGL